MPISAKRSRELIGANLEEMAGLFLVSRSMCGFIERRERSIPEYSLASFKDLQDKLADKYEAKPPIQELSERYGLIDPVLNSSSSSIILFRKRIERKKKELQALEQFRETELVGLFVTEGLELNPPLEFSPRWEKCIHDLRERRRLMLDKNLSVGIHQLKARIIGMEAEMAALMDRSDS